MTVRDYVHVLLSHWLQILITTAVGLAVAAGYVTMQPVVFTSSASVYVSPVSVSNLTDVQVGSATTQLVAKNLAIVGTTDLVLGPVHDDLPTTTTAAQLQHDVTLTVPDQSSVVQVSVQSSSPQLAAAIASAVSSELSRAVQTLTPNAGNASSVLRTRTVGHPQVSSRPIGSGYESTLAAGIVIGFAVGVLLAVVRRVYSRRITTAADLATVNRAPVIGRIVDSAALKRRHRRHLEAPEDSTFTEGFREVRANLRSVLPHRERPVLVVTSSNEGEGKTTTASNIAAAMAHLGLDTLIIDADLRRPALSRSLGLADAVGLSEILSNRVTADRAYTRTAQPNLSVMPAGRSDVSAGESLASVGMEDLLDWARRAFEVVVIDTPPLLPVADAAVTATHADGVLLVVRAGATPGHDVASAIGKLHQARATLTGFVLNRVHPREFGAYRAYTSSARPPIAGDQLLMVEPLGD